MRTIDLSSPDFLAVAEGATYSRANFGGAKVSFSLPCDRFTSCPFTDGEIVKAIYRGQTLLIGPVIQPAHTLDAGSEQWQIVIHDYWWSLENTIYLNLTAGTARSRGILHRNDDDGNAQAVAKLNDALGSILNHAINTAGIPIFYDLRIDNAAEIIPFAYAAETYASLIEKVVRWRPNLSAFFEYGADDSITLVLADYAQLSPLTLDIGQVDMTGISLKSRPDLVPPAIGLIANATVKGQTVRTAIAYPSGANLHQPYVVTAEIDVPEGVELDGTDSDGNPVTGATDGDSGRPRVTIRGQSLTPITADHIKRWVPGLEDVDVVIAKDANGKNRVTVKEAPSAINDAGGYYHPAPSEDDFLHYELIEGQISGKPDYIKWQRLRITVTFYADDPPKKLWDLLPRRVGTGDTRQGTVTFDVIATNIKKRTILLDKDGTTVGSSPNAADIPDTEEEEKALDFDAGAPYSAFVQSYYAATRLTPYDGTLRVLDPIQTTAGAAISITGGLPEWTNMRAIIQDLSLDLRTGVTELTVGAPDHISLQDAIDKSKQLAELNRKTTEATAPASAGDGSCGGAGKDNKADESAQLPTQGPSVTIVTDAQEKPVIGSSSVPLSFQATPRFSATTAGLIVGADVAGGTVRFGITATTVSAYQASTTGTIYLKAEVDTATGALNAAILSMTPGPHGPAPTLKEQNAATANAAYYCLPIATVAADKVTQHLIGDIDLPMSPAEADLDLSVTAPIKRQANGTVYLDVSRNAKTVTIGEQELTLALKINADGQLDFDLSVSSLDNSVTS